MTGFINRHELDSDESQAIELALSSCTDKAQRFLGGLPFAPNNLRVFWTLMDERFGEDEGLRVGKWRGCKQEADESVKAFSDRLQEQAWGLSIPPHLLQAQFMDNLKHSKEVKAFFCNRKFHSLAHLAAEVDN